MHAVPETGTYTTIGVGEFDLNDGVATTVLGVRPALAGTSLWADDLLLLPINLKLLCCKTFTFACLLFLVTAGGSIEVHAVIPFALDQEFGFHITGIHQVTV